MADLALLHLLLVLFSLFLPSHSASPDFRGFSYLLDCGATTPTVDSRGIRWQSDAAYISAGSPVKLAIPGLSPTLSTLRSFPLLPAASRPYKFCYSLPVDPRRRYLVRTTFFYSSVSGSGGRGSPPPVFDQLVDGTFWTAVNATADWAAGMASYYEGVFGAQGRSMSVCVAANPAYRADDGPFVSALEVIQLDDSMYNGTDLGKNAMGLIARTKFGSTGAVERYPDDSFDRYWQPFTDSRNAVSSTHNITSSVFWNLPPPNVFSTALVAEQNAPLVLQWPPVPLRNSSYYVALYFADTLPNNSRTFNVYINDYSFYSGLKVTSAGLTVFATQWILSGLTRVILTPISALPPLINAGEVFGLFPVGRLTHTGDVIALENIMKALRNLPDDWNGDPCMPHGYAWTGVTCDEGPRIRVVSLNLSSMGLSGSLSPYLAKLTALADISFAYNNLSGPIPHLSQLKRLKRLHLQDNKLTGPIPQSLGTMRSLRELFLQNNDLTGVIPQNLLNKPGLNLKLLPGNHFSTSPPSS